MELNQMRCKECKGLMSLRALEPIDGEQHGVHMRIEGMPAMQCAEGHKRFVAPEFAVKMMEALLADPLVPLEGAAQKGLLKKRYCCPGCGQELGAGDHGRVAAKRVLEMKGLNAFGVQVDLPKYRCAACGRESVEPKDAMVDDLMKASVQAFRSAEVAPT
jgi:DNA-directed RNA polymerase subunit RPC12/RpoP